MLEEQSLSRDAKAALKEHSLSLSRLVSSIKIAYTVIPLLIQRPLALRPMSAAVLQMPLANFAHVDDVFTLYRPDRLHQSNRGVAEDLTKIAEAKLQASERVQLNKYIASLAFFQGVKVLRFGLNTSQKATATELADLFKVLPVALVAFAATRSTILNAMQGVVTGAACLHVLLVVFKWFYALLLPMYNLQCFLQMC